MEQNFQTSFIPKKPMIEERTITSRPISFLTVVSVVIFFTVIIATGALYFYDKVLAKNITKMENDLNLAKNRFEPSKIIQLQVLDKRLRASSEILSKHIAISPIFEALQSITLKTVSYTKFSYDFDDSKNAKIKVKMNGIAIGYRSVAFQSDLFAKNKYLIDPVFSNLLLDDKGNVLFDLEFSVDPTFDNSKALEAERDKLTQKYNSFDPENLSRLQKLLPDSVDNIRLILEIEKIASPYGMVLKDVKYDATNKDNVISQTAGAGRAIQIGEDFSRKDYGIWDLEFSTQGTYNNFINFVKDLENNLRVVDMSSIQFSSNANIGLNPQLPEPYKYNFKIRTYWLKN